MNLRPSAYEADKLPTALLRYIMVPVTGLEPARFKHKILNLVCLPIPPYGHINHLSKPNHYFIVRMP